MADISRILQTDPEFNAFITTSAAHLSAISPGGERKAHQCSEAETLLGKKCSR